MKFLQITPDIQVPQSVIDAVMATSWLENTKDGHGFEARSYRLSEDWLGVLFYHDFEHHLSFDTHPVSYVKEISECGARLVHHAGLVKLAGCLIADGQALEETSNVLPVMQLFKITDGCQKHPIFDKPLREDYNFFDHAKDNHMHIREANIIVSAAMDEIKPVWLDDEYLEFETIIGVNNWISTSTAVECVVKSQQWQDVLKQHQVHTAKLTSFTEFEVLLDMPLDQESVKTLEAVVMCTVGNAVPTVLYLEPISIEDTDLPRSVTSKIVLAKFKHSEPMYNIAAELEIDVLNEHHQTLFTFECLFTQEHSNEQTDQA